MGLKASERARQFGRCCEEAGVGSRMSGTQLRARRAGVPLRLGREYLEASSPLTVSSLMQNSARVSPAASVHGLSRGLGSLWHGGLMGAELFELRAQTERRRWE